MEAVEKPPYVSVEDYLAAEEAAPYKSEYYAGEVVAMAGASDAHNIIVANILYLLVGALRDQDCTVRASDQRVHLAESELYVYPDATVVCGKPEFQEKPRPGVLLNPSVVVEVLSPSTEGHDRSDKLLFYLRIPALRHYLLIDSQRPRIEVYSRPDAQTAQWLYQSLAGLEATALLDTVGVPLALGEIYRRVEFPPPPPPRLV
jgi:Uma2 family endonuclease